MIYEIKEGKLALIQEETPVGELSAINKYAEINRVAISRDERWIMAYASFGSPKILLFERQGGRFVYRADGLDMQNIEQEPYAMDFAPNSQLLCFGTYTY